MKVIDIVGENYFGKWDKTRTACRGIIIHDTKVLLSYETRNDQWMLPGGGLEDNESEKACCIREIAEETGMWRIFRNVSLKSMKIMLSLIHI